MTSYGAHNTLRGLYYLPMARLTTSGRHILSASEIGSYTVCPESWRLKEIERVKLRNSERFAQGEMMHEQWASTYGESVYLVRSMRIIIALVVLALASFSCFVSTRQAMLRPEILEEAYE